MYSCIFAVFFYYIYAVSPAPEFLVPVFEFQISKLLLRHQTAFPFQISHKAGYAHFGRDFQAYGYDLRSIPLPEYVRLSTHSFLKILPVARRLGEKTM
jgi:hypothetical protein